MKKHFVRSLSLFVILMSLAVMYQPPVSAYSEYATPPRTSCCNVTTFYTGCGHMGAVTTVQFMRVKHPIVKIPPSSGLCVPAGHVVYVFDSRWNYEVYSAGCHDLPLTATHCIVYEAGKTPGRCALKLKVCLYRLLHWC